MRRHRTSASALAIALGAVLSVVLLASCGGTTATTTNGTTAPTTSTETSANSTDDAPGKKVFKEDDTDIKVVVGEKFGIRLKENPSIGDHWIVISQPDPSYLKDEGDSFKSDPNPQPGSGGQREFKYKARSPGTTTITFMDCYRCSGPGTSVSPENEGNARRVTFTVTVS